MQKRHGHGELKAHVQNLLNVEGSGGFEELVEVLAADQLGDDDIAILESGDIVHSHQVGVGERGHGEGLFEEEAASFGVFAKLLAEHFEGDFAVEAGVGGEVNNAHAAAAEDLVEAITIAEQS